MTKPEAMKACRWFQREVALAGWTIGVSLKECQTVIAKEYTPTELRDNFGISAHHLRRHDFQIWLNPEDAKDEPGSENDTLTTLMHELMHGALSELGIEATGLHEHLIDRLAVALAAQYRSWLQA